MASSRSKLSRSILSPLLSTGRTLYPPPPLILFFLVFWQTLSSLSHLLFFPTRTDLFPLFHSPFSTGMNHCLLFVLRNDSLLSSLRSTPVNQLRLLLLPPPPPPSPPPPSLLSPQLLRIPPLVLFLFLKHLSVFFRPGGFAHSTISRKTGTEWYKKKGKKTNSACVSGAESARHPGFQEASLEESTAAATRSPTD